MDSVLIRLSDWAMLEIRDDGEGAVGCIVSLKTSPARPSCGFDYANCGLFEALRSFGIGFCGRLYSEGLTVGEIRFLPGRIVCTVGEVTCDTSIGDDADKALRALFAGVAK